MHDLIVILYLALTPADRAEEVAVWWGEGAYAACTHAVPDALVAVLPRNPEARAYCAEAPSLLAPLRSPVPPRRPAQ